MAAMDRANFTEPLGRGDMDADTYLKERVEDQIGWYDRKNRNRGIQRECHLGTTSHEAGEGNGEKLSGTPPLILRFPWPSPQSCTGRIVGDDVAHPPYSRRGSALAGIASSFSP